MYSIYTHTTLIKYFIQIEHDISFIAYFLFLYLSFCFRCENAFWFMFYHFSASVRQYFIIRFIFCFIQKTKRKKISSSDTIIHISWIISLKQNIWKNSYCHPLPRPPPKRMDRYTFWSTESHNVRKWCTHCFYDFQWCGFFRRLLFRLLQKRRTLSISEFHIGFVFSNSTYSVIISVCKK